MSLIFLTEQSGMVGFGMLPNVTQQFQEPSPQTTVTQKFQEPSPQTSSNTSSQKRKPFTFHTKKPQQPQWSFLLSLERAIDSDNIDDAVASLELDMLVKKSLCP